MYPLVHSDSSSASQKPADFGAIPSDSNLGSSSGLTDAARRPTAKRMAAKGARRLMLASRHRLQRADEA